MAVGPLAIAEAPGQRGQLGAGSVQLRRQGRPAQRIDVGLLGEIEVRFEMCHHVEQMIAQRDDRPGEPARELLEGRVELGGVARFDHAQHRLGPREVDSAREERAERELARLGMASASAQAVGQDKVHEGHRADQMNLGHILARVGPRRRPEGQHHRQERPQTIDPQRARRDAGAPRRQDLLTVGNEARERDRDRRGAREPHDAAKCRARQGWRWPRSCRWDPERRAS